MDFLATDGATVTVGQLVAQNNTWGRGDLVNGRDFVQTLRVARANDGGFAGVRIDWAWPEDGSAGVRAYPEVFAGRKPWGPETGGDLLPLPLSAAAGLTARFAADWGGEVSGFNVAFDLWVSTDPQAGPEAITHEIMVWLTPGGLTPAGRPAGRLRAGALQGRLFARPDHGAGWTYLAVIADHEMRRGEIDLGALVAALQATGHLPAAGWLMTVELGAEVVSGAGWLEIRELEVAGGTPSAPPP